MAMSGSAARQGAERWLLAPVAFLSNALVQVETTPTAMPWFATINPVPDLVTAVQALSSGQPAASSAARAVSGCLAMPPASEKGPTT